MRESRDMRALEVDLSSGEIGERHIGEEALRKFLGGSGIGALVLYKETEPSSFPLAPESPLIVMNGLLTGTPVPTACKTAFCAKSPLTGIWGESIAGGIWGAELSRTSYDGLIIKGRSARPVYIKIDDEKVGIEDAEGIWGKDTYETNEIIKARAGKNFKVACIGPAGERLSKLASIILDAGEDTRAAGRGGLGAVMGSKNLKAIAVRGTGKPYVADKRSLLKSTRDSNPRVRALAQRLHDFGTAGGVESCEMSGDLPIKNFRLGEWREGARKTSGQAIVAQILDRHRACFSCPIRCTKIVRIDQGRYGKVWGAGIEYETTASFGACCLNEDLESIAMANHLCNTYGLDTISTGVTVAFAMEAFEKGIITARDTDGVDLTWGNGDAVVAMVHKIGRREGIGEILAGGVREAARALGRNSEEFAMHTKGLEIPLHDPRAYTSMALTYATASRGACHLDSLSYMIEGGVALKELGYTGPTDFHSSEGKARIAFDTQNLMSAYNALGLCKFLLRGQIGPEKLAEWTNYVTGWDMTMKDIMLCGERIYNLKRLYNVRLGISRKDDTLPPRLLTLDRKTGGAAGSLPHLGKMLGEYYELRGWTEDGIPTREKLEELGLEE
ncbi:MAG: aldehyde ferredoxin oxidoreductase family protein [bacterium]